MPGPKLTVRQQDIFWSSYNAGASIARAAAEAGFSESSGKRLMGKAANGRDYLADRRTRDVPDTPVPLDEVCDEARAALEDRTGALFARRYGGFVLAPWQEVMWEALEDAYDSPDREYLLVNGPPGGGKSTVLVLFCAKQVARDRSVRVMFISRAQRLADRNSRALRRLLERTGPPEGGESTLAKDFGRFKPRQGGEAWKATEGVVEQMDGSPIDQLEPTFCSFGFDSEWIGFRVNIMAGDDLDTTSSIRNMDVVEGRRATFDDELEPRIEEGGLLTLAQQRLGAFDFSAHVRSKMVLPDHVDPDSDDVGEPQYTQLAFRAHDESRCTGDHRLDAPAWPHGCLLNPRKLSWRDLRKQMNKPTFKVVYQQEDPGEEDSLVKMIWVDGGRAPSGEEFLGCWDRDRGAWEMPRRGDGTLALDGRVDGYISVDPSPTRYWSIQAWADHPASEQQFLLDHHRARMEAPDFLEWSVGLGSFTGLLEDWWHSFQRAGVPLRFVIVERNAAQRFMLQYDHFRRWCQLRGVTLIPHETQRNKSDEDYGVQMLAPEWRYGRVRLPGKGMGRVSSMRLVDEVTRYPHSATDDCVMCQWFFVHNRRRLRRSHDTPPPPRKPSWLGTSLTNARRLVGAA